MTTTIFGLRYKYESDTGQSLIFYERDGNELTSQDLHDVQLKMIHSNRIPHTLPLSVENLDLKTTLHYDVTARRKISTFLRNHDSTMSDYYQLFLSIIKTLEDCSSYMLNQQNYILNKEFIYVGENINDVYLTYLPITQIRRNTTVTEDIQKLLTDIAGDIQGLQGNEFKSILNYISDDSFSLSGLKTLLLELMSVRSNVHQPDLTDSGEQEYFDDLLPENFPRQNEPANQTTQLNEKREQTNKEPIESQNKKTKQKLPPLTSREATFLILGAVFLLAITWKVYDIFTNPFILVGSIVFSLYIVIGAFSYWKIWRPGVKKTSSAPNVQEEKVQNPRQHRQQPEIAQQPNVVGQNAGVSSVQQFQREQPVAQNQRVESQPVSTQHYQRESFHRPRPQPTPSPVNQMHANEDVGQHVAATAFKLPNLDDNHDDTVLLDDDHSNDSFQEEQMVPALIKQNEHGQEESISINTTHFLIGRNSHSVNYVETSVGVSRIHCEIMKIDGTTYAIKDLGAKNGTKINGDKLIPYKVYALKDRDEIEVGRATYTFSWGHF